ncbi:MAG: hypothetical protein NTW61_09055, partial [Candidatus Melainabacteria bacterium]|nr:hypothetical protein [Candidatus Melainabacteria bacterium]
HTPRKTKGLLAAPFVFPRGTRVDWFLARWQQAWAEARGSLIALLHFVRTSLLPTIDWLEPTQT